MNTPLKALLLSLGLLCQGPVLAASQAVEAACGAEPTALCLNQMAEGLLAEVGDAERRKINVALVAVTYAAIGAQARAEALSEQVGDLEGLEDPYARANILSDLSLLQALGGNQARSEELGKLASRETLNLHDQLARAELLFSIGHGQIEASNLKQAKLLADSLGGLARYLTQPDAQVLVVASQGLLYAKLGNAEAASRLLEGARPSLAGMRTLLPKVAAYAYLGATAMLLGETQAAGELLEAAAALCATAVGDRQQLTALSILLDAHNDLATVEDKRALMRRMFDLLDGIEDAESRIWALSLAAHSVQELSRT